MSPFLTVALLATSTAANGGRDRNDRKAEPYNYLPRDDIPDPEVSDSPIRDRLYRPATPWNILAFRVANLENRIQVLKKRNDIRPAQRRWELDILQRELASLKAITPGRTTKQLPANDIPLKSYLLKVRKEREKSAKRFRIGFISIIIATVLGLGYYVFFLRHKRTKRSDNVPRALDPQRWSVP
jgi:hypothetical protein